VSLINRWVWHPVKMCQVMWNVKIMFYSNNHNGITFESYGWFILNSLRTATPHVYMLVSFVILLSFIRTNYSINGIRQTLHAAKQFALQRHVFLVPYIKTYIRFGVLFSPFSNKNCICFVPLLSPQCKVSCT
jgi:hypothetical protein